MRIKTDTNSFRIFPFADGAQATESGLVDLGGTDLALLFAEYQDFLARPQTRSADQDFVSSNTSLTTVGGAVVIEAVAANGEGARLLQQLESLGLQQGASYLNTVSGLMPIARLQELTELANLSHVAPSYIGRNVGSVENRADIAMQTDVVRASFGIDGTGISIGILSDSFDTSTTATTNYADDIATGDLPSGINILQDFNQPGTIDEGRAMAQLIHDIVPGSDLAFATAFGGQSVFANNIGALAAISDVVVDDIFYFVAPFFQDGIIAQAVDAAFASGVQYYSSAGNFDNSSYESDFRGASGTVNGVTGTFHDFDPGTGVDLQQDFVLNPFQSVRMAFQWDDPYIFGAPSSGGADGDVDLVLFDTDTGAILGSSTNRNLGNDPWEFISYQNGSAARNVALAFHLFDGAAPGAVKYIDYIGNSAVNTAEYATLSGASFGHSSAEGGLGVAAAFYQNTPEFGVTPPQLESFSSQGGTPFYFDVNGNRLATPEFRDRVDITAPDGTDTTFFGSNADDTPAPNFFGTSAAAPHAAAVGALLLDANPTLTPTEVYDALQDGAIDVLQRDNGFSVGAGFDDWSGHGLIDAPQAFVEAGVGSVLVVDIATDEDDGNTSAGDLSLREAIGIAQSTNQSIQFDGSLIGATIRLDDSLGTINITGGDFRINGDINGDPDRIPDIIITGDSNGDDTLLSNAFGVSVTNAQFNLNTGDNVQLFEISGSSTSVRFDNLVLTGGNASSGGGAAEVHSGAFAYFSESTIEGNTGSSGGALRNFEAGLTLDGTTVTGNVAASLGGGIYSSSTSGSTAVVNSTVSNNSAQASGGGIFNDAGLLSIQNSTITDNSASFGAGVGTYNTNANFNGIGSTVIAGNIASASGQDVEETGAGSGAFTSFSHNFIGADDNGAFTNGVNNDIVGTSAAPLDPLLGGLVNNGGPNATHLPSLLSPLVDAGENSAGLVLDQRLESRLSGVEVDIGSVERLLVPDLIARNFTASVTTVEEGDQITWGWIAENIGEGDSAIFDTGVYISSDTNVTTQDVFAGFLNTDNVTAPGDTESQSLTATLPTLAPGVYYAAAIADDIFQVAESDETNNASNLIQITVQAPTNPTVDLFDVGGNLVSQHNTIAGALSNALDDYTIVAGPAYSAGPEFVSTSLDNINISTEAGQTTSVSLFGPGIKVVSAQSAGNLTVFGTPDGGILNGSLGDDVYGNGAGANFFNGNGGFDTLNIFRDLADVTSFGGTGDPVLPSLVIALGTDTFNATFIDALNFNDVSFDVFFEPTGSAPALLTSGNDLFTGRPGQATFINGFAGQDVILANNGNDTVTGGQGDDTMDGGDDRDLLSFAAETGTAGVLVTFNNGRAIDTFGDDDTFTNFEDVEGSVNSDTLSGNSANNVMDGNDGNDRVLGQGGDDTLIGGMGNDTVSGGGDADSLVGGQGEDLVLGGGGNDIALEGGADNDTVSAGGGNDSGVDGGDGDDIVLGAAGNDQMNGGNDNDTLSGGTGEDTLDGDAGADLVLGADNNDTVSGGTGNDTVSGGTGNDLIMGDAGDDRLLGASGNDTLIGGADNDFLSSGTGLDSIVFGVGDGLDTVVGYEQGVDMLMLDEDLWLSSGTLTEQEVIDTFATQLSPGVIEFVFDGGEEIRLVNGSGLDITTFASDVMFIV